jgi:hypothetical protein
MPTQIKALHATSRKDSVDDEHQSVLLLRYNVDVMELKTTCCEATEPTLPATTVATHPSVARMPEGTAALRQKSERPGTLWKSGGAGPCARRGSRTPMAVNR